MGHLSESVNSRVGAASYGELWRRSEPAEDGFEGGLQLALNSSQTALTTPAVKVRPVVGDAEANSTQLKIWFAGHRQSLTGPQKAGVELTGRHFSVNLGADESESAACEKPETGCGEKGRNPSSEEHRSHSRHGD